MFCNLVYAADWTIGPDWTISGDWTINGLPPVALFTKNASIVYIGIYNNVSFDASTSYDLDGTIVAYFWDFGDETNATTVTTTHYWGTPGTYTVTLTVTDNDALTDDTFQDVQVLLAGGSPSGLEVGLGSFGAQSSLGFGCGVNETLKITVVSGMLSSQNLSTIIMWDRGEFSYHATNDAVFSLSIQNLAVAVKGDGGRDWHGVGDGATITTSSGDDVGFKWSSPLFDPFSVFADIGIGLFGFICVGIGCFWGAYQVKRDEWIINRFVGFGFALTFLVIGCGLIIGWLW